MEKQDLKLGIFSFPLTKSNATPSKNLVSILSSISHRIFLLTSTDYLERINEYPQVSFFGIDYILESNSVKKVIKYLHRELQLALLVKTLNNKVDAWIFFFGGDKYILPMVTAKLSRKKIILLKGGSSIKDSVYNNDVFHLATSFSFKINMCLSTHVVLYSQALIADWGFEKYRHKILIANRHFIDPDAFSVTTPLVERPRLIGYIGRLSGEKGIQNFVKAIPVILHDRHDLRVLIGGDGQLREAIGAQLWEEGLTTRVDLPGWISHGELPKYLNQLSLLVIPSHTEGLPNIMLEAMACGTPVLATAVGVIPDIIVDGKTGFIMENNSPECIAKNVKRALDSPILEQIAESGRWFVLNNFTFEKAVGEWKKIFREI